MKNIVNSDILDIHALLADLYPFPLLFRPRAGFPLPTPKRALAFAQSLLVGRGRVFSRCLNCSKPGLLWGARPDLRMASFGRCSGAGMVVS